MQFIPHAIIRGNGDTRPLVFRIVKKDAAGNETLQDVTGWSFQITFNTEEYPLTTVDQIATVAADMTDAANGKILFNMATVSLPVGEVYFDVRSTDTGGLEKNDLRGKLDISQDIGR